MEYLAKRSARQKNSNDMVQFQPITCGRSCVIYSSERVSGVPFTLYASNFNVRVNALLPFHSDLCAIKVCCGISFLFITFVSEMVLLGSPVSTPLLCIQFAITVQFQSISHCNALITHTSIAQIAFVLHYANVFICVRSDGKREKKSSFTNYEFGNDFRMPSFPLNKHHIPHEKVNHGTQCSSFDVYKVINEMISEPERLVINLRVHEKCAYLRLGVIEKKNKITSTLSRHNLCDSPKPFSQMFQSPSCLFIFVQYKT